MSLAYLMVFALFAAFLVCYLALNTRRSSSRRSPKPSIPRSAACPSNTGSAESGDWWTSSSARAAARLESIYGDDDYRRCACRQRRRYRRAFSKTRAGRKSPSRLAKPETPPRPRAGACRLAAGRLSPACRPRFRGARSALPNCGQAARWAVVLIVVMGLAGGIFVTRRVLHRIDAMTATTRTIMAGDLTGRLAVTGRATSSTAWPKASMPCWSASRP